jgi:hypothetical protein
MIASTSNSTSHCGSTNRDTSMTVVMGPDLGEPLRVRAGGLLPVPDVGEHHPDADHVGQGGTGLVECLFGDVEAADRLGVDVTGGCGAAVLRDRRGPSHADIWPGAHGTRKANLGFKR